jgi:hypothetical protein
MKNKAVDAQKVPDARRQTQIARRWTKKSIEYGLSAANNADGSFSASTK